MPTNSNPPKAREQKHDRGWLRRGRHHMYGGIVFGEDRSRHWIDGFERNSDIAGIGQRRVGRLQRDNRQINDSSACAQPQDPRKGESVHKRRHIRLEVVENSGQLKRYRRVRVIGNRTCEVHHSKCRAHNGRLILVYGVCDGQAVGLCGLRKGGRKKKQRQRAANNIQKTAHESPP
jgi:hypothetical protein